MSSSTISDSSCFTGRRSRAQSSVTTLTAQIWTPVEQIPQQSVVGPDTWFLRVLDKVRAWFRCESSSSAPRKKTTASRRRTTRLLNIDSGNPLELRVTGYLTAATVPALIETLADSDTVGCQIEINLGGICWIDTASVAALVKMSRNLAHSGGQLRVTGISDATRRVMSLCDPRLADLLEQGKIDATSSITAAHEMAFGRESEAQD